MAFVSEVMRHAVCPPRRGVAGQTPRFFDGFYA